MKKSCTFLYWLIFGNWKRQVYGFQQKYIYFIFNSLWQAFHIPLHCFAGLGLQAVCLRNPKLLISIYRWQEYIKSLHVFGINITRTLGLQAYNLYIFNYTLSVKNRKRKRGIQQYNSRSVSSDCHSAQ